jgi:hypothetical protein
MRSYDLLQQLRDVSPMPMELDEMEQQTSLGIIKKLKAVLDSEYVKSLPSSKVIVSGGNDHYNWFKSDFKSAAAEIYSECKDYL